LLQSAGVFHKNKFAPRINGLVAQLLLLLAFTLARLAV